MVVIVVLWEVVDPEAVPFIDAWRNQGEMQAVNVPWHRTTIHSRHGSFGQDTGTETREVAPEVPTAQCPVGTRTHTEVLHTEMSLNQDYIISG